MRHFPADLRPVGETGLRSAAASRRSRNEFPVSDEEHMCRNLCVCFASGAPALRPHLFDDDFAVLVDGAVVDHAHYGQAAQDGDDVAAGQPEAPAVAQRGLLLRGLPGPPVLRQLDHLSGFLPPLHHPVAAGLGAERLLFKQGLLHNRVP